MPAPRPPIARPLRRASALALCILAVAASAKAQPSTPVDPSTATPSNAADTYPLWEIGLYPLFAWEPAYPGSDQHLTKGAALPYAVWRGSLLRVEKGVVGVRGARTPRFEWDVSASAAFGSSANEVRARAGMPAIGTLVQLGPALQVNIGDLVEARRDPHATRFELPVRAVFDASNGLAHQGWTLQPQVTHIAWQGATSSIVLEASMLFADRQLAEVYYGVDPAYATPERPAYAARAGLVSTGLTMYWRKRFGSRLRMQWFIEAQTVRGGANVGSPLVRRMQDVGFGASLTWAAFVSRERGSE